MIGVRSRSRSLQVGLASVLVAVAACGGAAPEAAAPSTASPAAKSPDGHPGEPSTVEQAQDQIAAAKAELAAGATGSSRFAPEPPAATGDAAAPSAARPSRIPSTAPPKSTLPPAAESATGTPSCGSPCRALASMRRAVTALCRMTGVDDTRCLDARRTLADSEGRIAPCSC